MVCYIVHTVEMSTVEIQLFILILIIENNNKKNSVKMYIK